MICVGCRCRCLFCWTARGRCATAASSCATTTALGGLLHRWLARSAGCHQPGGQHQGMLPGVLRVLAANSPAGLLLLPLQQQEKHWAGTAAPAGCSSSVVAAHRLYSTSSLREELGSGSALGQQQRADSNSEAIAARRQSLLAGSGARFYDTVRVEEDGGSSGGYRLLLRTYPIKTPAKHMLLLPTRSLALAVAGEWEWLPTGRPAPHVMPLTGLACTAIDQPKERSKVVEHLLKYVHTDGACIRYEPGALERRQQRVFDPLLGWAAQQMGWRLTTTHSISGTTQPDATVAAIERWLNGLDAWRLAAAEQLVTSSKSVVLAAASLEGRLSASEGVAAARLEEDFQLEDWGAVEAGHDLDIADTRTRIGAATLLVRLLDMP